MKRAALYVRVSSQGQVRDGYSLAFQEEILKEFCQRESLVVTKVYRDGGQSGSSMQRAGLISLIEDARQHKFDVVLIFRVDRFSRDPVDLLALVRELETRRIKLRSVTESVDASDPSGELMLTMLGAIGKYVRQNIIQNAMLGKKKRAEGGLYTGGKVPFGYQVDENGIYTPDERTWWGGKSVADVVRLVFATYIQLGADGGGCKRVANQLNELGIPAPGKVWAHSSVHQLLKNPCYTGDFAFSKRSHQLNKQAKTNQRSEWIIVPNAHEPIVERETWERVQKLLKANSTGGRRPGGSGLGLDLLSGFLTCATCGRALTPRRVAKNQRYLYFTCASKYSEKSSREGTTCSDFPWLRADRLEELIWSSLSQMGEDSERIEAIRNRMGANGEPQGAELRDEIGRLTKRKADLERQAMMVTTTFAEGKMPEYLWQRQLERLESERRTVEEAIEKAQAKLLELTAEGPPVAETADIQAHIRDTLAERFTLAEKREALSILIGHRGISVSPSGTVDLDIRVPRDLGTREATANPSVSSRRAL